MQDEGTQYEIMHLKKRKCVNFSKHGKIEVCII